MTKSLYSMTNNSGLGRGLGSLIPQKVNKKVEKQTGQIEAVDILTDDDKNRVLEVDPGLITENPMQPRQVFSESSINELAESIEQHGIIQPLIVTKTEKGYELIAGERRLRASKKIGLETVPIIVREIDEQKKLEVALIENIQRESLNPIETAIAYQKLIDEFNLTQEKVAKRVGKSRPVITNSLRLMNLPDEIQQALVEGKISEGHAKYILGLENEVKQMTLFRKILNSNLSVHETNAEIRRTGGTKAARIKINYKDKDKEFAFREFFGTKVEIKRKGKGGQIIIDFFSDDELENMVSKIK